MRPAASRAACSLSHSVTEMPLPSRGSKPIASHKARSLTDPRNHLVVQPPSRRVSLGCIDVHEYDVCVHRGSLRPATTVAHHDEARRPEQPHRTGATTGGPCRQCRDQTRVRPDVGFWDTHRITKEPTESPRGPRRFNRKDRGTPAASCERRLRRATPTADLAQRAPLELTRYSVRASVSSLTMPALRHLGVRERQAGRSEVLAGPGVQDTGALGFKSLLRHGSVLAPRRSNRAISWLEVT